jgi:iron(III) transport system permease protein
MVIPSYLGAVTYIAAFGPRGMLQQLLEPITGVTRLASIYGFFGAWLAITLFTYPYVVLPVRAALMNMDPALEETARSMGLRRWQVFRRVVLPQLRPALAAGTVITALYTLSDFGAVAMMRYNALTRAIYVQYTGSFDRHRAAILALVLVILTIMLLIVERRATKHTHNYRVGTGAQRRMRPVKLGRWRLPALVFCGTLVTVGALVPVGVLFYWLMQKTGSRALSLDLNQMLFNTISVSVMAALVVAFAALPLGLLAVRSSSRVNQWLVRLSYFGYVLPGIVVALALVFFAANYLPGVYQTLPILLLGYSTRFLPLSVSATQSALTQVNPRYEEVARCLGLNRRQVLLRISVPLARAGILGGAALVFLNVMKELPTTLILAPTGFKTFSMHIWSSYEAATLAQIGAPGLLLVAVSAISLYLILGHERQEGA